MSRPRDDAGVQDLFERSIEEIHELREGWEFEAKRALGRDGRGKLPKDFWPSYSAMANTNGGVILLGGVERADGSLDLVGFANVDGVEQDLWSTLDNTQKVSVNLLARGDIQRLPVAEGRWVLRVRVRKASRDEMPVYINGNVNTGTYIRRGTGDKRASEAMVTRLIADSLPKSDARLAFELNIDDLDPETIQKYRRIFASKRPDHPYHESSDPEFLQQINAVQAHGRGGPLHPTRAGVWMFGTKEALLELNPSWFLSFKRLPTDASDDRRWVDRVYTDGSWPPNLFEFYLRAQPKLVQDVPMPFSIDSDLFRRAETKVHAALREALVNCLVHADHQGNTGIRIEAGPRGYSFRNPGLLLIPEDRLWAGGASVPRNPILHELFSLVQLGEREGSGGRAMWQAWRSQAWREPRIVQDDDLWETQLVLGLESLLSEKAVTALEHRFGDRYTALEGLGREILAVVETEREASHARLVDTTGAHPREITLALQRLRQRGLLKSAGRGRRMTYLPATEADVESGPPSVQAGASSTHSGPRAEDVSHRVIHKPDRSSQTIHSSTHRTPSSINKTEQNPPRSDSSTDKTHSSTHKPDQDSAALSSSTHKPHSSTHKPHSSTDRADNDLLRAGKGPLRSDKDPLRTIRASLRTHGAGPLSPDMIELLRQLPLVHQVASTRRATPRAVQDAIVHLCGLRPMTVNDLAQILRRKKGTLRQSYLKPLVDDGRLVDTAATPTDPRRAYRAATDTT